MTTLDALDAGSHAQVVEVGGDRSFRRRLMELGFLPGTRVRLVRRLDVGGTLEVEVRRSRLTLRCRDAASLLVLPD